MKVKICGLRRAVDAECAIELGASHVGVVLAADSPRCATREEAAAVVAVARGRAEPVLVFRGESHDAIVAASDVLGVRRVQAHGADAEACERLRRAGLRPIQVARVAAGSAALPGFDPAPSARQPALLDGGRGGEGQCFVWSLLSAGAPEGVFVAGGIRPDNVRELLTLRPWGIDVSSGVEREPGVKDAQKLTRLFQAVRAMEVTS